MFGFRGSRFSGLKVFYLLAAAFFLKPLLCTTEALDSIAGERIVSWHSFVDLQKKVKRANLFGTRKRGIFF